MILTVTLNPSVDISYRLEAFHLDTVNRTFYAKKTAGGKGLNVTRVLQQVNEPVIATGFVGGDLGRSLIRMLSQQHIQHEFIEIKQETRNCIAVLHEGKQTEILEMGPRISKEEADAFLDRLKKLLKTTEIVTISGSLPDGLDQDYYVQILKWCCSQKIISVLDCSGKALQAVLNGPYKPTVIKPNLEELSQLMGESLTDDIRVLKQVLRHERFSGIEWIIVSLGSKGTFAKCKEKFYRVTIPNIQVVNPVGSGDATVAGIASSLLHHLSEKELLKRANVFGMLNAQEELTGYINLENADYFMSQVKVTEV